MAPKKKLPSARSNDVPKTLDDSLFYGFDLDEEQKVFANAIWNPDIDIVFVNAVAGTGKAQPCDTIIPTPTGNKQLGDLKIGDLVFDGDGKPTTVLGVYKQGMQKAYRVTLSDGRSTICAGEHLWTYYGYRGKIITETLNSMMQRKTLCGDELNSARYNIPVCMPTNYPETIQKVDPYVMGVFLGNGCCTEKYLTLSSNDEETVAEVANILGYTYRKSPFNYCWTFYNDGKLVKTLDVFGDYPSVMKKSNEKSIPQEYIYCSIEQRFNLLQGLFDTDGCITVAEKRYNVRYSSTSKSMIDDLCKIIYSLGYAASITVDKRDKYTTGICYGTHIRMPNSDKINMFRLSRKKEIAKRCVSLDKQRRYDRIAVRDIQDLGYECEMVCIYVDNPKHLYLTNDYIVTHNTTVATGVANLLVQYGLYESIVYIMSPYGERKQGWLPGTITEKSSVYFEAFYQALINCNINPHTAINDDSMVNQKNGTGYITCITDTFLRGSNLDNAVIIIDEAQNYTVQQLKKTLTRIGKKAKVIVIGHDLQCDLDNPEQSGFTKYIEHFKGKERAAFCTLTTNHRSWISQWADEVE